MPKLKLKKREIPDQNSDGVAAYNIYVNEKLDQLSFLVGIAETFFDIYPFIRNPEVLNKFWRRLCLVINHPPAFDESNIEVFFEKFSRLVDQGQGEKLEAKLEKNIIGSK